MNNDKDRADTYDLVAGITDFLKGKAAQASPYKDPIRPSYNIYMIPSVTGLTAVMGIILILMYKGYRDLRSCCNNNADGIDRLQG